MAFWQPRDIVFNITKKRCCSSASTHNIHYWRLTKRPSPSPNKLLKLPSPPNEIVWFQNKNSIGCWFDPGRILLLLFKLLYILPFSTLPFPLLFFRKNYHDSGLNLTFLHKEIPLMPIIIDQHVTPPPPIRTPHTHIHTHTLTTIPVAFFRHFRKLLFHPKIYFFTFWFFG